MKFVGSVCESGWNCRNDNRPGPEGFSGVLWQSVCFSQQPLGLFWYQWVAGIFGCHMIKLLRTPSDTCLSYWVTGMSWSCGLLAAPVLRWLSVSHTVMDTCGFCLMVELSLDVCWGRSWVLTLFCIFLCQRYRGLLWLGEGQWSHILIVPFLLWLMFTCGTLPFFYFPNCHTAHGRELFSASQPFSWWNSSLFFFPQFYMWELNTDKFLSCLVFPPCSITTVQHSPWYHDIGINIIQYW